MIIVTYNLYRLLVEFKSLVSLRSILLVYRFIVSTRCFYLLTFVETSVVVLRIVGSSEKIHEMSPSACCGLYIFYVQGSHLSWPCSTDKGKWGRNTCLRLNYPLYFFLSMIYALFRTCRIISIPKQIPSVLSLYSPVSNKKCSDRVLETQLISANEQLQCPIIIFNMLVLNLHSGYSQLL